jgi:hypothetical protein
VIRHRGTTPFDAYEIDAGDHLYSAALALKWQADRKKNIGKIKS